MTCLVNFLDPLMHQWRPPKRGLGTRNDSLIIHFELGNEALNGAGVAAVIWAISVNFWPVLYDAMTAATSWHDVERRKM